jgi:hypothetical protein
MCSAQAHVRFAPESDIKRDIGKCPLWAKSGHRSFSHRRGSALLNVLTLTPYHYGAVLKL